MELPFAESWKIKMVEPIRKSTRQEREQWLKEAHYNVFQLKSEQVYIDLITDSGTGAMSDRQWAGIMLGDESYAGASSFFKLKEVITRLTGFEYVIPTHQGRAAENVLFSYLVHEGDIIPGNSHFDTTKGHIESRKAIALDCTIDEARQTQLEIPFKGNVDPAKLEKALQEHHSRIPFIIVTITNNTAGGQPVFRPVCLFCRTLPATSCSSLRSMQKRQSSDALLLPLFSRVFCRLCRSGSAGRSVHQNRGIRGNHIGVFAVPLFDLLVLQNVFVQGRVDLFICLGFCLCLLPNGICLRLGGDHLLFGICLCFNDFLFLFSFCPQLVLLGNLFLFDRRIELLGEVKVDDIELTVLRNFPGLLINLIMIV